MAELQDTDILLVNRGSKSYQVTGLDMKDSLKPPVPPGIKNVSLVEADADGLRFTNQSFISTTSMAINGDPPSTKTIDAYVEGQLTGIPETSDIASVGAAQANPWSSQILNTTNGIKGTWQSIAFGKGVFVAAVKDYLTNTSTNYVRVGLIWSEDGYDWNDADLDPDSNTVNKYDYVAFVNDQFVAFQNGNRKISVSNDGKNWTAFTQSLNAIVTGLVFAKDLYVATSTTGGEVYTTTDLSKGWIPRSTNLSKSARHIAFGNNRFFAVTDEGVEGITSTDGITWTAVPAWLPSGSWFCTNIIFADGLFRWCTFNSSGGSYKSYHCSTSDGVTIDVKEINVPGDTATDNRYGCVGHLGGVTVVGSRQPGTTHQVAYSTDLTNWTGVTFSPNTQYFSTIATGNGRFVTLTTGSSGSQNAYANSSIGGGADLQPLTFETNEGLEDFAVSDVVTQLNGAATGTIGSIDIGTKSMRVFGGSGTWAVGQKVLGPERVVSNARKYLKFDNSGAVSDLIDAPQSPAYTTSEENPVLTLTFPGTFPSGKTPDEELLPGTTLTTAVTATNPLGSHTKSATVQPVEGPPEFQILDGIPNGVKRTGEFGQGTYIIVGDNYALKSTDGGLTWVQKSNNGGQFTNIATDNNGNWTAVNSSKTGANAAYGAIYSTDDGETWTTTSNLAGGVEQSAIEYAQGVWCAIAYNRATYQSVFPSFNGFVAGSVENGGGSSLYTDSLVYGNGFWMSGARTGNSISISSNGLNFTANTSLPFGVGDLEYSNGYFYATSYTNGLYKSADGLSWTQIDLPDIGDGSVYKVRATATGRVYVTISSKEFMYYSDDGVTFTKQSLPAKCGLMLVANGPRVIISVSGDNTQLMMYPPATTRSLTADELDDQSLSFATYNNRRDATQREEALGERESLRQALIADGATVSEVASLFAMTVSAQAQAISGYYPLYTTEADADAAGNGASHAHVIDGVTYYMPDGGVPIYHGNYNEPEDTTSDSTDSSSTDTTDSGSTDSTDSDSTDTTDSDDSGSTDSGSSSSGGSYGY